MPVALWGDHYMFARGSVGDDQRLNFFMDSGLVALRKINDDPTVQAGFTSSRERYLKWGIAESALNQGIFKSHVPMPFSRENITYAVREIVGIGTSLKSDEKTGNLRITKIFPNSPAGQAGLSADLMIQKINGLSVEGKSMKQCLSMLGGRVGTKVRLEVFDPDRKETRTLELTRQKFLTATE